MRMLLVTDNRFWREQIGSQRRIASLLKHFVDQGHELFVIFAGHLYSVDVSLLSSNQFGCGFESFGLKEELPVELAPRVPLRVRIRQTLRKMASQGIVQATRWLNDSFPSGRRVLSLQFQEPKLRDFVDKRVEHLFVKVCEKFKPEAIIVEYVRLAYLLETCRMAIPEGCRTLIDTHDVQFERQARFHDSGQVHDIDITATEEARALSTADAAIAIQATDALKLSAICPGLKVIVAGFAENIYQHPARDNPENAVRVAFFGSDMPPNRDAASLLVKRIFPLLRSRFAERFELHLFGKVCETFTGELQVPGLILHGFVDDLAGAYAQIDLIANPIAFGGGLKIKNVEALCHGRAMLTTSVGSEGLESGIGTGFLVADSETEFASCLEKLIEDDALRNRLSLQASEFARQYFSAEAVYGELDAYMRN